LNDKSILNLKIRKILAKVLKEKIAIDFDNLYESLSTKRLKFTDGRFKKRLLSKW